MPLAKCPKCGAVFPNTLRECPNCHYSPFARRSAPPQNGAAESIVMEEVVTENGTVVAQPVIPQDAVPQNTAPQNTAPQDTAAQEVVPQAVLPQPFPPHTPPAPEVKPPVKAAKPKPKLGAILLPIAAAVVLIAVAAIALPNHGAPTEGGNAHASAPDPAPTVCADGEHEWIEATCTQPKTCARCGETEGEPLGHNFVDNVCTRCGAYEKLFTFSDLACKRRGGELVFSGAVRNYSDLAAKKLELRLEFFDENKQVIFTDTAYILEDEVVQPQEAAVWRFTCAEPDVSWKYWRVSITNFILG